MLEKFQDNSVNYEAGNGPIFPPKLRAEGRRKWV
jgi:hypothetical protein